VTLSCSGVPANATCTLSPSLLTLDGSRAATVEVSIPTAGTAARLVQPGNNPPAHYLLGLWWGLPGMLGLTIWTAMRRRRRGPWILGLTLLCLLSLAIAMPACGGGGGSNGNNAGNGGNGSPGTPQGTYEIVVTGSFSSGSSRLAHSTELKLIVQ